MVGERYNLDGKDFTALGRRHWRATGSTLRREALEKGMTVEQLAQFKKMERENKSISGADCTRTDSGRNLSRNLPHGRRRRSD